MHLSRCSCCTGSARCHRYSEHLRHFPSPLLLRGQRESKLPALLLHCLPMCGVLASNSVSRVTPARQMFEAKRSDMRRTVMTFLQLDHSTCPAAGQLCRCHRYRCKQLQPRHGYPGTPVAVCPGEHEPVLGINCRCRCRFMLTATARRICLVLRSGIGRAIFTTIRLSGGRGVFALHPRRSRGRHHALCRSQRQSALSVVPR